MRATARGLGRAILALAPWLMKFLSVAGTAAMFLVGGGIIVHGVPTLHHIVQAWAAGAGGVGWLVDLLCNAAAGVVTGGVVVGAAMGVKKLRGAP